MKAHRPNRRLKLDSLPTHLAIIMDGNGRWATRRGLPRIVGHQKGAKTLESIVNYAFSLHIPIVSVFAFSTENWKRPKEEIDGIFKLLKDFIDSFNAKSQAEQEKEISKANVKVKIIGDISRLPKDLVESIKITCDRTQNCDGGVLNIALNYGGRADIVQACNKLLAQKQTITTESEFEKALYTEDSLPVDFVIRTGGDIRISNFMLYQMAYAELYFTKTFWPDFTPKHLDMALIDYQKRKRKFGSITN